ncbi:putative isomerase [Mariniphaga anaerophila]|uniref:Putative isomerase n=1 Tax=Mariniphaga anaerophila TaxID=1484053 RepID=A0A1M5FAP2_9BACT|nr:trehalase family glycosidase [Mariniphaga anaerophila]SHF88182.1 putative isomerase [Mariniphaga anaerophila]
MKLKSISFLGMVCMLVTGLHGAAQNLAYRVNESFYADVIDVKNVPEDQLDSRAFVFSDMGAWHGYALPEKDRSEIYGGFIGPRLMTGRRWISKSLCRLSLTVDGKEFSFRQNCRELTYYPGRLVQQYANGNLQVDMELIFVSTRTALIQTKIRNTSEKEVKIEASWIGELLDEKASVLLVENGIKVLFPKTEMCALVQTLNDTEPSFDGQQITIAEQKSIALKPQQKFEETIAQTVVFNETEADAEMKMFPGFLENYQALETENYNRWNGYFEKVFSRQSKYLEEDQYRRLAVKTIITLVTNWRSPAGDILHDGVFPSYVGFNSFWAWDSWKHAAGLALFDVELAQKQVLAMFDYQDEHGMIPDLVSIDKKWNNWRDTKPPLAAWAVYNIFREGGSKDFVAEILPKLLKYHYWWYRFRDHDSNGLCEYGSTDGTLVAAAWESGMDNAVRFDNTAMLKNEEPGSWSTNQESVDLNSFLYAEKKYLAKLLQVTGNREQAGRLEKEAEQLKNTILRKMFNKEQGFFFDKKLSSDSLIAVCGPEGWLPLWAEVVELTQAKSVAAVMAQPSKFNTKVPLGTLAVNHPGLQPYNGYWRGPVWIDQLYFGIVGLKNYQFDKLADELLLKYLHNAEGLLGKDPIHENYNPLTGERLNAPHFSWSSALTLRLLAGE